MSGNDRNRPVTFGPRNSCWDGPGIAARVERDPLERIIVIYDDGSCSCGEYKFGTGEKSCVHSRAWAEYGQREMWEAISQARYQQFFEGAAVNKVAEMEPSYVY